MGCNIKNVENLKEPLKDADTIENIQEPTFTQDLTMQEPTLDLNITDPTTSPSQTPTIISGTDYKYIVFSDTSTQHTVTFSERTICDILVIGGGAGGGGTNSNTRGAGDGGAGEYEINEGIILLDGTTLTINIGAGGTGGNPEVNGSSGQATTVSGGGISYEGLGGGGGSRGMGNVNGIAGACGGGGSINATGGNGTRGGDGGSGGGNNFAGGGGGMSVTNGNGQNATSGGGGGIGGEGVVMNITGFDLEVCGGGDCGGYTSSTNGRAGGSASFGGGGGGGHDGYTTNGSYAGINASSQGSGGGGGTIGTNWSADVSGGNGFKGIVIIRYKYQIPSIPVVTINDDYKYFSFPQTSSNQTPYNITFQEETEVQLIVSSNSFVRFISPFTQTAGKINILVGNGGGHSSYGSTSTSTETTPYNSFNSGITGEDTSYNNAIVIVRYRYKRETLQFQTINDDYKYIIFPKTDANQTPYSINFPEMTEVQILLLDDLEYIETDPFTMAGQTTINVGVPSTFNTLTTNTNATSYNSRYVSTITGQNVTYNEPVVIVRYKTTKIVIVQVTSYRFLQYNEDNVWEVSDLQTIIDGLKTRIEALENA